MRIPLVPFLAPALLLSACSSARVRSPEPVVCRDSSHSGSVAGLVLEEASQEPLSARVGLLQSSVSVNADKRGHFHLSCLAPGLYTVRAVFIGYESTQKAVRVAADSTAIVTLVLRSPGYTGIVADSALWRPLWTGVLGMYQQSQPTDAQHINDAARLSGTPTREIPTHPRVILRVNGSYWKLPASQTWTDSLVHAGLVDGVCGAAEISDCPDTTFRSFVELEKPRQLAADTFSVAVHETLLNPAACRRRQGGGDSHQFAVALTKRSEQWVVVRRVGMQLMGGTYCEAG